MKPIPVWHGVVTTEGALKLDARSLFTSYVKTLANTPVTLTLKRATRPKSSGQLGFLFGVLYPVIADGLGYRQYEVAEVHDACMRELRGLKPEPNPLKLRVSLGDNDHEFTTLYIDDLRHWAVTEFGIITPDAGKAEAA